MIGTIARAHIAGFTGFASGRCLRAYGPSDQHRERFEDLYRDRLERSAHRGLSRTARPRPLIEVLVGPIVGTDSSRC